VGGPDARSGHRALRRRGDSSGVGGVMSPRRALFGERDQALSTFAATLGRLCDVLPAQAAALVDGEGETVDYAGRLIPYETRVAAAEWQLVAAGLKEGDVLLTQPIEELVVHAR